MKKLYKLKKKTTLWLLVEKFHLRKGDQDPGDPGVEKVGGGENFFSFKQGGADPGWHYGSIQWLVYICIWDTQCYETSASTMGLLKNPNNINTKSYDKYSVKTSSITSWNEIQKLTDKFLSTFRPCQVKSFLS